MRPGGFRQGERLDCRGKTSGIGQRMAGLDDTYDPGWAAIAVTSHRQAANAAGWHAAVEYVDLSSVAACAQVLAQVIIDFCGTAPS